MCGGWVREVCPSTCLALLSCPYTGYSNHVVTVTFKCQHKHFQQLNVLSRLQSYYQAFYLTLWRKSLIYKTLKCQYTNILSVHHTGVRKLNNPNKSMNLSRVMIYINRCTMKLGWTHTSWYTSLSLVREDTFMPLSWNSIHVNNCLTLWVFGKLKDFARQFSLSLFRFIFSLKRKGVGCDVFSYWFNWGYFNPAEKVNAFRACFQSQPHNLSSSSSFLLLNAASERAGDRESERQI